MSNAFPSAMDYTGFNAPSRIECDVHDLVVEGQIPAEVNGSWYQTVPDPQYAPMIPPDTYLSGDCMMRMLRFENGRADLKQRYVQSERFKEERRARRALYGRYRNPYTDDPSVRGKSRAVYNTTPIFHGGRLLALKEDSRAMEIHPRTLETLGEWDYRGKLRSQTMTAQPRFDPETGEMFFFGYEASGLASRDVSYCIANKDGELVHEEWFQAPYCSLMHDFVVTQEHVIFPVFPITADLERMKAGGTHWIFEPGKESFIGIMPRRGSVKDMRWFRGPARSAFHYMNAFTEGSRVHMDFGCGKMVPFPFIREASGIQMRPEEMAGSFVRWSFDLSKPGDRYEESVLGPAGDMPRTSNKDQTRDYGIGYYQSFDPTLGPPNIAGPVGAGFNTIVRIEIPSGRMKRFVPGGPTTVQEHVHIPSKQPNHEGYLGFIVDRHADSLSEFVILEAQNPDKGPLARVQIPLRLRVGVHGNWVPAESM